MALPLYLAVTGAEFSSMAEIPFPCAYMACHFSPYTNGLTNLPENLPDNGILILNDRMRCSGHSADLVVQQLQETLERFHCESILLDFQRSPDPESKAMVKTIVQSLSCPVAVTEAFAADFGCPVFLAPAPLHIPLAEYLEPWKGREIWLEAALCQEEIVVTPNGAQFSAHFPPDGLIGGFYDDKLCCCYRTKIEENTIRFILFDTKNSLQQKLSHAHSQGVRRSIGLWQELGNMA